MRSLTTPAAAIGLSLLAGACATGIAPNQYVARVGMGQTAALGTVRLVPLQLLEDSRCPAETQCVSAGELRLRVSVQAPHGLHQRTLLLGKPELVSGGTLLLDDARPLPAAGQQPVGSDYRFTFRFTVPRTH